MPEAVSKRFVGRRAELREISARAASAARGQRQTVLIEGRPGIGKTTLLHRALEQLADFTRLWADCALGNAVDQLITAANQTRRTPSGPRSRGLLAAVQAVLERDGPLLLALDNVQLIDVESAAEFSAVLPALRTAALLVIVAARDPWRPESRDGPQVERLRLQLLAGADVSRLPLVELSVAETAQLLDFVGTEPSERAATRLHRYTGGHPALLSVLLGQGLTTAHTSPADLLGLFDPLAMSVLRTVSCLPEPSRSLLAAMAVYGEPWPIATAGSVARVEDPFEALEPLLDAGLVEWFPDDPVAPVAIRYPLYRDVIYRSLPAARRETLHRRAARFELGTRAWAHRVAATGVAEPALAATLEQEATSYYLAGDNERAGQLLIWSTAATSDPNERERHLMQAAHWWPTLRAVDWGPRLEDCLSGWPPSASRSVVLGLLAEAAGRYEQARGLLADAGKLARADGSWTALRPDIDLAAALISGDLGEADAEYRLAEGLLALKDLPAVHRGWAEYFAADAWGRMNGPDAAAIRLGVLVPDALIDGEGGALDADRGGSRSVRLWARGTWRVLSGRLREGNDDLARMLRAADRAAADPMVPMAHAYMGYAHYLLGDWKAAEQAVAQAIETLDGHGVARLRVPVHAVAACVEAAGGRQEAATRHLQAARRWHAECGPEDYVVFPAIAAATVAQARGDYARMLAVLAPLLAEPGKTGTHRWLWQPLHVEALIGTGKLAVAQDALDRLTDLAGAWSQQAPTAAWLGAWLSAAAHDNLRARAMFEQAAARPPAPDDVPLHRARLEHEYGRFLMSGRNRRAAIARLRRAYELYRALGALPFAERAARDLEACGAEAASGGSPGAGPAVLSSRERRIAYLAAQGLTNQEIAGELFVSTKTVEYHLGNVFAKLGISSRRQLPARLGGEPGI